MNAHRALVDDDSDDVDPRRTRSRNRLLDAAAALLSSGGIEAVTIDAVTKASKVAKTTLYRHFGSSSQLIVATFERLLPQVAPPAPAPGTLREQLIDLLTRQAILFAEAPLHVTMLAWIALGPTVTTDRTVDEHASKVLRARVIDQYRQPFDAILQGADAKAQLDEFDPQFALCQLVGPLVFARMTGLRAITADDCARLVDDFLAIHLTGDTSPGPKPADPKTPPKRTKHTNTRNEQRRSALTPESR